MARHVKLPPHTKPPFMAVAGMVETLKDNVPDLCSCYPEAFGQLSKDPRLAIANAEFIATACNTHSKAIKLLIAVYDFIEAPRYTEGTDMWCGDRAVILRRINKLLDEVGL